MDSGTLKVVPGGIEQPMPSMKPLFKYLVCLLAAGLAQASLQSCTGPKVSREVTVVSDIKEVDKRGMYLKVHMKDGELYVLHTWTINESAKIIIGLGNRLDYNRKIIESRSSRPSNAKMSSTSDQPKFTILLADVAAVEKNRKGFNSAVPLMILVIPYVVIASLALFFDAF